MKHAFARKVAACSLTAILAFGAASPGFAAERAAGTGPPTLLASGTKQVHQMAKSAIPRSGAMAGQEGMAGGYDEPGTFFKTKRGIALLVLAGAGIGYMWYSKVNDRIHSVERERQGG